MEIETFAEVSLGFPGPPGDEIDHNISLGPLSIEVGWAGCRSPICSWAISGSGEQAQGSGVGVQLGPGPQRQGVVVRLMAQGQAGQHRHI